MKACAVEAGVTEDQLKAIKETSKVDIKDPKLQVIYHFIDYVN